MAHINARCDEDKKQEYLALASAFGYDNFSEFIITLLDSMVERYRDEGWESHLLHMHGDRVIPPESLEGVSLATAAFPVVAPARFWNHVQVNRRATDDDEPDSSPE